MGASKRQVAELKRFMSRKLEDGEEIDAMISVAASKWPSSWYMLFGAIGAMMAASQFEYAALVVTDRRVFLVQVAQGGKPQRVTRTQPREDVTAVPMKVGPLDWGWKGIEVRGLGKEGRLRVPMPNFAQLKETLAVLRR